MEEKQWPGMETAPAKQGNAGGFGGEPEVTKADFNFDGHVLPSSWQYCSQDSSLPRGQSPLCQDPVPFCQPCVFANTALETFINTLSSATPEPNFNKLGTCTG